MTSLVQKPFCTVNAIAAVRQRIDSHRPAERLAFIVLSGSFDPVHTGHVRALEIARRHIEDRGWDVLGGFLAPSTDDYVRSKIRGEPLPLARRIELCDLAVQDLGWLSVCQRGEFSSNVACRSIRHEIEQACADVLRGRTLTGVEVMDSDTAVRILSKVVTEAHADETRTWQSGRVIYCLSRHGADGVGSVAQINALRPSLADLGVELMIVEPGSGQSSGSISSSGIRELISKGDWATLQSNGWLHGAVADALRRVQDEPSAGNTGRP